MLRPRGGPGWLRRRPEKPVSDGIVGLPDQPDMATSSLCIT